MVTDPVEYPFTVGVKKMGNLTLAPGGTVTGTLKVPKEKVDPCTDLELMLIDFEVVLLSWTEMETEVPTGTWPKPWLQGLH
jgi:hypothetical protein